MDYFKLSQKESKIPSTTLSIPDLNRLLNTLSEINTDCKTRMLQRYNNIDDAEKKKLADSLVIALIIYCSNGEEFYLTSDQIDETKIPSKIERMQISNNMLYRFNYNGSDPDNYFEVTLDFAELKLLRFDNPSKETVNNSYIKVRGNSDTLVKGSYNAILGFFKNHENSYRKILHRNNFYDVCLYIFCFPIFLFLLNKYQPDLQMIFNNETPQFNVVLFLVVFLLGLVIFVSFFNFTRWLYPYQEIEFANNNKNRVFIRRGIYTLFIVTLASSVILYVFKSIFM